MSFSDADISARVRDAIKRIAESAVEERGTTYRYGTVTSIDYANSKVEVQFPGSAISVPVKTLGVQPTAVGQVVQVSGRGGDHFVTGVVGATSLVGVDPATLGTPVLSGSAMTEKIALSWTNINNAASYELQAADDSAFTVGVETFQVSATSFNYAEVYAIREIYFRVRALTWHDPPQAGAWSATYGPVQVFEGPATDGSPPVDSPDVALVSGLGYLQASWPEQANADPITYEVHIGTVSGFAPDATTLYDETGGTTFFIKTLADGTPLAYDTDYYVRIFAKDGDGYAPNPGAQAVAQIDRVETGDAGNIGIGNISDGLVPSASPDVGTVTGGVGYLFVTWAHVANVDPVTYEVHVSTVSDFAPDANTLVGDTPSNYFFIREQGPGALSAPLEQATTYYIKLISKDADGYAAAYGLQGSGALVKAQTADLVVGSITAASGIIADLAIGTAKIQDAAITTLKVADAAISTAKISDLAVTNAKIASLTAAKITAGTISGEEIILSGGTGILRSSGYTAGSLGWRIDGNGNAEFNNVTVRGTILSSTIVGSSLATASSGPRIELYNGADTDKINFFDFNGDWSASIGSFDDTLPVLVFDTQPGLTGQIFQATNSGGTVNASFDFISLTNADIALRIRHNATSIAHFHPSYIDFHKQLRMLAQIDMQGNTLGGVGTLNLTGNATAPTNWTLSSATHLIWFERSGTTDILFLGANDFVKIGLNSGASVWATFAPSYFDFPSGGRISAGDFNFWRPNGSNAYWKVNNDEYISFNDTQNRYTLWADGGYSTSELLVGGTIYPSDARRKQNLRPPADESQSVLDKIKQVAIQEYETVGNSNYPDDGIPEQVVTRRGFTTQDFTSIFGEDHPAYRPPVTDEEEPMGAGVEMNAVIMEIWRGLQEVTNRLEAQESDKRGP